MAAESTPIYSIGRFCNKKYKKNSTLAWAMHQQTFMDTNTDSMWCVPASIIILWYASVNNIRSPRWLPPSCRRWRFGTHSIWRTWFGDEGKHASSWLTTLKIYVYPLVSKEKWPTTGTNYSVAVLKLLYCSNSCTTYDANADTLSFSLSCRQMEQYTHTP